MEDPTETSLPLRNLPRPPLFGEHYCMALQHLGLYSVTPVSHLGWVFLESRRVCMGGPTLYLSQELGRSVGCHRKEGRRSADLTRKLPHNLPEGASRGETSCGASNSWQRSQVLPLVPGPCVAPHLVVYIGSQPLFNCYPLLPCKSVPSLAYNATRTRLLGLSVPTIVGPFSHKKRGALLAFFFIFPILGLI